MFALGIHGGMDGLDENSPSQPFTVGGHDAAAVILQDDRVLAAFEEERLNRIKHTSKFPSAAIQACLDAAGLRMEQLDCFAINKSEEAVSAVLQVPRHDNLSLSQAFDLGLDAGATPRAFVHALLRRHMGSAVEPDRIHFVKHHIAHAQSAFALCGWDEALVVTMDGVGNAESLSVSVGTRKGLENLRTIMRAGSLGLFYFGLTQLLGFQPFDEYKVMGLASHGDPKVFRSLFRRLYSLLPNGEYKLHPNPPFALLPEIKPRYRGEPLEQKHMDVAAATQELLEVVAFHVLEHFRKTTGMTNLCLAGGVAQNSTLNGKIAASRLFSGIFVQPASYDAGCALGAAIAALSTHKSAQLITRMPLPFLGTAVSSDSGARDELEAWTPLLSIQRSSNIAEDAADLLAKGHVIGWAQGRAEFGPRALGNRSILADPRPAENKHRINAIIKKREDFRPFAPAVVAEYAQEYFELPQCNVDLSHMTYVLKVRPEMRSALGAVTHVDGTARVQTVTREGNERFWQLLLAFGERIGMPILLNTSFNSNVEPIVDSIDDAVVCFLTTDLDRLVVDNFIVSKMPLSYETCRTLAPSLPQYALLNASTKFVGSEPHRRFEIANSCDRPSVPISNRMYRLLEASDGRRDLQTIVDSLALSGDDIWEDLLGLWSKRQIVLGPRQLEKTQNDTVGDELATS